VRRLSLRANKIGNQGLRSLAASPHSAALEALELGNNDAVTPAGLMALLCSPACVRLRWLSLEGMLKPRMATALAANAPESLREFHRGPRKSGEIDHTGLKRLRAALPNCAIG
jgi:hypothetical protein